MSDNSQQPVTSVTTEELVNRIQQLEQIITQLTQKSQKSQKEMTDEHAEMVCYGIYKDLTHKTVCDKLSLSYGQIYSCRLEYTFRHIHKKLQEQGQINKWKKK